MFNNGIIYHVGHENGDVDVFPVLSGLASIYLGNEVFCLPDIRLSITPIDFSNVRLTEYGYSGLVEVADKVISLPQYTVAQDFDTAMRSTYADLASPPEVPRPEFIPTGTPDNTYNDYTVRIQRSDLAGNQSIYRTVAEPDPRIPNAGLVCEGTPFTRVSFITEDASEPQETPEEEPMPF